MDWTAADMLLLGVDVEEFRLEKNIKPEKSLDEIEKLYVDENLSQFEKACQLATSNYDIQKIWAMEQLIPLLKSDRQSTIMKLLPKIVESLQSNNIELHKVGSKVYSLVANEAAVDPSVFVSTFLLTVLTHFENKNTAISNLWFETLISIIPTLPKDILKNKIFNIGKCRGQLSQSVLSRQNSCRIIGKLAGNMDSYWIKQELLPLVKTLSQDVDSDVRQIMCFEITNIAKSLSKELCGMFLLPEIEKLSKDEEVGVRCAAMETLTELISLLEEDYLKEKVVPLILWLLDESASKESGKEFQLKTKSCELIGRFAYELKACLTTDQSNHVLDVYNKLANTQSTVSSTPTENITSANMGLRPVEFSPVIDDDQGAECRRLCAYNIPAMMLFADYLKETGKIVSVIKSLCSDPHEKIRRTIACGFHEVVSILGENSHVITKDLGLLLQDKNVEVLQAIIKHFPDIVDILIMSHNLDPKTRQPGLLELIQPLLHFEEVASTCRQWRLHATYMENLSCLTLCMTSDQLYHKFVPLCWKCISTNVPVITTECKSTTYALPVKLAASRTLCLYIKSIRKLEQRREICTQFITDCACSDSHKLRLLYINVCCIILELFSRQFFKEQGFYSALLKLSKDPSVNIRLKLSSILPRLKTILLLPTDREYQKQFESAIATLLMDQDSDTLAAVHTAVKNMDKLNYKILSMTMHSLLEEDIIDKEREEEEHQLLKDEEEFDKEKDSSCTKLTPDIRRSAVPINRSGIQSPNMSRVKKQPMINKRSPNLPRKSSNYSVGGGGSSSNPNSPGALRTTGGSGTKLSSTTSTPGRRRKESVGSALTPDPVRKTLSPHIDQTPSDTSISTSRHVEDTSSKSKPSIKRSTGSSPNLNSSNPSSPRTLTVIKSKDQVSTRSSPTPSTRKPPAITSSHYGLTYTTKASK